MSQQPPSTRKQARRKGPVSPKEPLLVFRGQGLALLLPMLMGLMAFLLSFAVLQSSQRVLELHRSLGLAVSALTVFVPTTPGLSAVESDPAINRALDVLQNTAGLGRIQVLDRPSTQLLIGEALGKSVSTQVPLPTVITVQRARRAVLDSPALQQALERAAPGAMLDDNQPARSYLLSERNRELTKAALMSALILLVVMVVVVLVVSLSMDLQNEVLDVLFMSGASDALILGQFVGFVFRSAVLGALVGGLLALLSQVLMEPALVTEGGLRLVLQALLTVLVFILVILCSVVAAGWRVQRKLKRTF